MAGWMNGCICWVREGELVGSSSPSTQVVSSLLTNEMVSGIIIYQTQGTYVYLN